jgi:hypothetical protein
MPELDLVVIICAGIVIIYAAWEWLVRKVDR